jgi:hypothetical protein
VGRAFIKPTVVASLKNKCAWDCDVKIERAQ